MSETVWHLLKTTCYGPLAIHTKCVNTILFVLHCIISLCSFIIPVRIQSFFGNFLICRGLYLNNVFFLWRKQNNTHLKKKEKRICSFLSTVMASLLTQRLFEMSAGGGREYRLWIWSHVTISPRWQASRQTCGPDGEEVKGRLLANPTTQPLTDCSLFWSSFRWITVTLHHE